MKNIILVDGNALLYRAFHGVGKGFEPLYEGRPVGMVYGVASAILSLFSFFHPEYLAFTFDTKEKTFRHDMDEDYKAQRVKAPDEFYAQIPLVEDLLTAFGIPFLKKPGFESDDIIGTLARKFQKQGFFVLILSTDLDFLQLVGDRISLVRFDKDFSTAPFYTEKETFERLGVFPSQVVDFKALVGDSADNYKGVSGLGPKTAAKFLQEYKTLEGIYEHISHLPENWRTKLLEEKEYVFHCRSLAQIHTQVPLDVEASDFQIFSDPEKSASFLKKLGFHSLSQRFLKMSNKSVQSLLSDQEKISENPSLSEQMSLF